MAGTETTEGRALWQPGGAEEDSHFCEGYTHLRLAYEEEEEEELAGLDLVKAPRGKRVLNPDLQLSRRTTYHQGSDALSS